jgi:uncharacterized protein (DUF169 family)
MASTTDLSILRDFDFAIEPIGVKYFTDLPDGLPQLTEKKALCEMIKLAQSGESFYADPEHHACDAGVYVLGQSGIGEKYVNGEFGAGLGLFCDTRAAARLYNYLPHIARDVVKYVALSPLSKLTFDPDVLIMIANTTQLEIILRATSYKSGKGWVSRYSPAIGCSWLFAYPYLNGEMNFIATGLGFGMRRRKLFPEGHHIVSIPFDQLAALIPTLKEMPWVPEPFKPDGLEYVRKLKERLGLD